MMDNKLTINDICKEAYSVISNFDSDLLDKIPENVYKNIIDLAADSEIEVNLDLDKELVDQDISEETKDLISLIYCNYVLDNIEERKKIMDKWEKNEEDAQEELRKKYNPDEIFKINEEPKDESEDNKEVPTEEALVEKNESLFVRIINKIKKLIKID